MSEKEREEERKFLFQLTVSGHSEGLCTIHPRGMDQQVGAKARLPSLRVLLDFWQLHNKAMQRWSCALRKKTKLAKRTSHLSFDEKNWTKEESSESAGKQVMLSCTLKKAK